MSVGLISSKEHSQALEKSLRKVCELIYQVSLMNFLNLFDTYLLSVCRFSTGFGVSGGSTLIHEFYSREVQNPIHLTVDTGFTRGEASIKAYISSNLSLRDSQLAAQFQEIPLDLKMIEAEKAGCMLPVNSRYIPSIWGRSHFAPVLVGPSVTVLNFSGIVTSVVGFSNNVSVSISVSVLISRRQLMFVRTIFCSATSSVLVAEHFEASITLTTFCYS